MRLAGSALLAAVTALAAACRPQVRAEVSQAERTAIADSLKQLVAAAYDLSNEDAVARLMSLYADSGPVISASGGRVSSTRDELETAIRQFWDNVGRNMRDPRWSWSETHVEVLGPDAAVLTATYRIPHRTPAGSPHVIGGAWTAVFARRHGEWVIVHEHLSDAER